MKFFSKASHPLACLLLAAAIPAMAQQNVPQLRQTPSENTTAVFDRADMDGNGLLSFEEARQAFPGVNFEDRNRDGWLNHGEAERALPDLGISIGNSALNAVVGEADFLKIRARVDGIPQA